MMFLPTLGVGLVWTGLAAIVVAIAAYLIGLAQDGRARDIESPPIGQKIGRIAYCIAAASVVGIAICHSTLLMTHRFDINYVYRYSARGLSSFYLFSTFWAGQEGSFLLWGFWTALLGVVLATTAGRRMEGRVMPVYGCVLGFILILLAVKSPFAPYAPVGPMDPQGLPKDGMGLNPLLENPWMVVHPPTLFLGFASLAVTFAFAFSALVWGDFDDWFRRTWPWALFSVGVLGFGIMLGGYWAYDTQGWGGFWEWDPVEIGPFVPWLGMVAFVHGVQAQRARGSLKKTTLFLGLLPFSLALYETFLTRTGILDKFSVHSFSTLGGTANSIILYGLLITVIASLALLIWRARQIKNESDALDDATSRDFGLTVAIGILLACALISGIGMSAPLITQVGVSLHIVQHQSSVQTDFYNRANFPVACLLLLGMAIGPYLTWRETKIASLEPSIWCYMGAVAAAIGFYLVGRFVPEVGQTPSRLNMVALLIMFTFAAWAILANARLLMQLRHGDTSLGTRTRTAGGVIAHLGIATILIGIVCLVSWYREDSQTLVQGHPFAMNTLPMTLGFDGSTSNLNDPNNKLKIEVWEGRSGPQSHYMALLPVAIRDVEGVRRPLARPAIVHRWWGDLYFSLKDGPEQISPTPLLRATIQKGETKYLAGYAVTFRGFSVPPSVAADVQKGIMPAVFPVTAHLDVKPPTGPGKAVDTQFVQYRDSVVDDKSPEVRLPPGEDKLPWAIAFVGMNADSGSAQFYVRDAGVPALTAYTVQVTTRPMIGLVWLGVILVTTGSLLSMRRRALENRLIPVPDPPQSDRTGSVSRREAKADRRGRIRAGKEAYPGMASAAGQESAVK
jgi:cytochrome c-type biogenesis protein CcmF